MRITQTIIVKLLNAAWHSVSDHWVILLLTELHAPVPHRNTFVGLHFHVLTFALTLPSGIVFLCESPEKK